MTAVSIFMPVYNCVDYVDEAIDSIRTQTLLDWELIVLDDGSTDGSWEKIASQASADQRIRAERREHRGIVAVRNEGLRMATGEYFAIMDADDVSLPARLEKQLAYLKADPECMVVSCRMEMMDPEGDPIRVINLETTHEEIDEAHLRTDRFFVCGAYVARTETMRAIGGYRAGFPLAEDRDLWLRLAEIGRVACIPEVQYRYRQHPVSSCHTQNERLKQCVLAAVRDAQRRRGLAAVKQTCEVSSAGVENFNDISRKWAWWALQAGNVRTARKHAYKALRKSPFSPENWRLAACALRGY